MNDSEVAFCCMLIHLMTIASTLMTITIVLMTIASTPKMVGACGEYINKV